MEQTQGLVWSYIYRLSAPFTQEHDHCSSNGKSGCSVLAKPGRACLSSFRNRFASIMAKRLHRIILAKMCLYLQFLQLCCLNCSFLDVNAHLELPDPGLS